MREQQRPAEPECLQILHDLNALVDLPIAVSLLGLGVLTIALATPTHDMRIPRNRAASRSW